MTRMNPHPACWARVVHDGFEWAILPEHVPAGASRTGWLGEPLQAATPAISACRRHRKLCRIFPKFSADADCCPIPRPARCQPATGIYLADEIFAMMKPHGSGSYRYSLGTVWAEC